MADAATKLAASATDPGQSIHEAAMPVAYASPLATPLLGPPDAQWEVRNRVCVQAAHARCPLELT